MLFFFTAPSLRPRTFVAVLVFFNLALFSFLSKANAAEYTVGGGGKVSSSPYKATDSTWTPFPLVSYEGDQFFIRGFNAGIKIIKLPYFELSAFAGYDATSFSADDSHDSRLRKLNDRHSTAVTGLELRLMSPYGMLHASGMRDMLGNSNGFNGTLGYILSMEFGPLELLPAAGVFWDDSKNNNYYYGISSRQARKSQLSSYSPGGGFSPYLSFGIDYSITNQLELFCQSELTFLSEAIHNSPMVGTHHTQSLTFGLSYTF